MSFCTGLACALGAAACDTFASRAAPPQLESPGVAPFVSVVATTFLPPTSMLVPASPTPNVVVLSPPVMGAESLFDSMMRGSSLQWFTRGGAQLATLSAEQQTGLCGVSQTGGDRFLMCLPKGASGVCGADPDAIQAVQAAMGLAQCSRWSVNSGCGPFTWNGLDEVSTASSGSGTASVPPITTVPPVTSSAPTVSSATAGYPSDGGLDAAIPSSSTAGDATLPSPDAAADSSVVDAGDVAHAATADAALGDAALGDAALGDAALGDAALGDSAFNIVLPPPRPYADPGCCWAFAGTCSLL